MYVFLSLSPVLPLPPYSFFVPFFRLPRVISLSPVRSLPLVLSLNVLSLSLVLLLFYFSLFVVHYLGFMGQGLKELFLT